MTYYSVGYEWLPYHSAHSEEVCMKNFNFKLISETTLDFSLKNKMLIFSVNQRSSML